MIAGLVITFLSEVFFDSGNQPIKYSGWKTNWELSSARALAVLHYLVDECKVKPNRLSANGYGEFRPVAANDTKENMQKNRRVEIVILLSKISGVAMGITGTDVAKESSSMVIANDNFATAKFRITYLK